MRIDEEEEKMSLENRWLTPSNFLTSLRIVLAPCVCIALHYKLWKLSVVIFLLAAGTDLLDGFLARLLNDHTHLGRILDPIADKLFLVSSFGSLAFLDSPFFKIPAWFFILIVIRESILLVGGYLVMLITGGWEGIKPSVWGKLTTFGQIVFIVWIFWSNVVMGDCLALNNILLVIISILSLFSLFHYVNTVYFSVRSIKN